VKRLDWIEKLKITRAQDLFHFIGGIWIAFSMALDDEKEYPDKKDEGYIKLYELYVDLKKAYKETYKDRKKMANKSIQPTAYSGG
jgi:hypothetical protein